MEEFWSAAPSGFANEADVELRLVEPLLGALGYEVSDIAKGHAVIFQQGRTGRPHEADYVVFNGPLRDRDTSLIVIEVKGPDTELSGGKSQGESYAFNLRAPLLVLTNGIKLEVWQLQTSQESSRVLDLAVAELRGRRGELESLLSKTAAVEHCRRLAFKDIKLIVDDYSAYEEAELVRTLKYERTIERTLQLVGSSDLKDRTKTSSLLDQFQAGAVIVAPSGYGKTTLCYASFRKAIESRWKFNTKALAFDVPLADLAESGSSLIEFACDRLAAHCPGSTEAAVRFRFRTDGAILFCDGFDRLTAFSQQRVEAEIRTLLRDYPKITFYIFSREASKPNLPLSLLTLEKLSGSEQRDMERLLLAHDHPYVVGMLPNALAKLCDNPLLLELTCGYWEKESKFPTELDGLFRSWLDTLLDTKSHDTASVIACEEALTILAEATIETAIGGTEARQLLKASSIPGNILKKLMQYDAVRVSGTKIELQHEALADYLRAKVVASMEEAELLIRIATIPLRVDSLFPSLLMALMPSHRTQAALWTRLSGLSVAAYLDALRYRSDVSDELGALDERELADAYLDDFLTGIESPLRDFFPQLREVVTRELVGERDAELGIIGKVYADPPEIIYGLRPRRGHNRIVVGTPDIGEGYRSVNLGLSGYRMDSGRLLGASVLRDALCEAVNQHHLVGGAVWATERLAGRLRFLAKEYHLPIDNQSSFDELESALLPYIDKVVWAGRFSTRIHFSIESLIEDIALLRERGQTQLDRWWIRLGWSEGPDQVEDKTLAQLLDEYYRRLQQVYAELIEHSFSSRLDEMGFYSSLPVRWKVRVVRGLRRAGTSIFYHWLPVASWDEAGADVEFGSEAPPMVDFTAVQEALARFDRLRANTHVWSGFKLLPSFDGTQWTGLFDGATPVTHDVCSLIVGEVKTLFSDLPHSDGIGRI